MLSALSRVMDRTTSFATALAGLSLVATCLLILVEIGLRNLANTTTGISVEYSMYFMVFMVFAALAHTQRSGAMIYMEIAYDRYPARVRRLLNALRWTLGLVYGLIAVWELWHFTTRTCALGQVSMFPSRTPLCAPQAVMVLGMAFLTIEFLRGTILGWRDLLRGFSEADDGEPTQEPV